MTDVLDPISPWFGYLLVLATKLSWGGCLEFSDRYLVRLTCILNGNAHETPI